MRTPSPLQAACVILLGVGTLLGTASVPAESPVMAAEPSMAHPAAWPVVHGGVPLRPDVERFVDDLLARMTLEEKVGQMLQADISSAAPADVERYGLGSVLAGGNSAPKRDLRGPAADWLELTREYAAAVASGASAAHAPIPLLFAIDAVHGHGHARGATIFPHNIALGAMRDVSLLRRIGAATAAEVAATGIDWVFAPTVAVTRDVRWGRSYESFSADPALVAADAAAVVAGLQGGGDAGQPRVVATIKHFIGDGGTVDGRDQGENLADEAELIRVHAAGYRSGIEAGALTVMASYSSWQGRKMHDNRSLLTDVLKGRMRFNGFVIGDWNGHDQIPGCTKYDCPAVINAGVDMVMAADGWQRFRENTLTEVRAGIIPETRIDDAVRRILRVKALAGLFAAGNAAQRATPDGLSALGAPEHRAIAREAVRRSLVLLKNEGGVLPIRPDARVLVAGAAADDIGVQAGGWTIDWQGDHNRNEDFPGATSIYGGIRAAVSAAGGSSELSVGGDYQLRPDVAVVVFGERPYAEYDGDRESLLLGATDIQGLDIIRRLHAQRIPVVAVLLSGRPLWMNREINASDAFVEAWLPGTEGGGVADVLVGRVGGGKRFDFSGRLPVSWPATARSVVLDGPGHPQGQLYATGYGLHYGSSSAPHHLAEDPGLDVPADGAEPLFAARHVWAPWSLYLEDSIGDRRQTTRTADSQEHALNVSIGPDGARARWRGGSAAELLVAGRGRNLSAQVRPDAALQVTYLVHAAPQGAVRIGVRCGPPYGAPADVSGSRARRCGLAHGAMSDFTATLRSDPGNWHTLTLPLRCFPGADLRNVGVPFAIRTEGAFDITFADIRLADVAVADAGCVETASDDPDLVAPPH